MNVSHVRRIIIRFRCAKTRKHLKKIIAAYSVLYAVAIPSLGLCPTALGVECPESRDRGSVGMDKEQEETE